jgi:UDP-N-acetylmuramate dehydrogenase
MMTLQTAVALAPFTSIELGGPAAYFVEATSLEAGLESLWWAREKGVPTFVLGGGSNLLVPDEGFDGLVLAVRWKGLGSTVSGDAVELRAAAGERWDDVVAWAVAEGWQGLECLSGIPGLAGATVVQNVGAYGQDVSETVAAVEVIDCETLEPRTLSPAECAFGYRDSVLKRSPGRFLVTAVTFRLQPNGLATPRYAELARVLGGQVAGLGPTREAVLALRRSKSMVFDAHDVNRRSVGSFFTNPVVEAAVASDVVRRATALGLSTVPRWPQPDGRVKLAAGWLVEHAGVERGLRRGAVGVSSAHALALVHHGGGTTAELLELASWVKARVLITFGVELEREAVLLAKPG